MTSLMVSVKRSYSITETLWWRRMGENPVVERFGWIEIGQIRRREAPVEVLEGATAAGQVEREAVGRTFPPA
jgi:hypothetical protein